MPDYGVLISTLGGLEVLGMNGIVLGPVIAAMFMVVWDILATSNRRKATSSELGARATVPCAVA
jgi:predicted PurR-regulated permease PerM